MQMHMDFIYLLHSTGVMEMMYTMLTKLNLALQQVTQMDNIEI